MAAESEEFERAWAQIVADLTADAEADLARLARGEDSVEGSESSADVTRTHEADLTSENGPAYRSDSGHSTEPGHSTDPGHSSNPAEQASPVQSSASQEAAGTRDPGDATLAQDADPAPAARQSDPAAFVDGWSDEGHFTPPPPPDLPAGSPATRLGWAGALGGIATLVGVTLTGWNVPRFVMWAAGLAALAGFVTLVWQLPESRDDGWDDGAQV